jgi:8-oxo-dGTP pyrophosphatase MutT (NUDIX family)
MKILRAASFWLTYPLLWIYLKVGTRTRVLVIVDDLVLLLMGHIGLDQWGLPGGGVHCGEEPLNGAIREVKEETGINLSAKQLKFLYHTQSSYKGLKYMYDCFYVQLTTKPPLQKQAFEVAKMQWLPLLDVDKINATKETKMAVRAWLKQANLLQ